jgi:hypothetical protein
VAAPTARVRVSDQQEKPRRPSLPTHRRQRSSGIARQGPHLICRNAEPKERDHQVASTSASGEFFNGSFVFGKIVKSAQRNEVRKAILIISNLSSGGLSEAMSRYDNLRLGPKCRSPKGRRDDAGASGRPC